MQKLKSSTHFDSLVPAKNMVIDLSEYFDLQHLDQHIARLQKPFVFQADLFFECLKRQTAATMQKLEVLDSLQRSYLR